MIISGNLLLVEGEASCCVCPGTIRIEEGVIVELDLGEITNSADFGGDNCFVLPGLIDAHLHLAQFDLIGAHGMPLLKWLDEVTFPSELRWADVSFAAKMTRRVAKQLLAHGTTGIAAYATVHHEATLAALGVLSEFGFRGAVGQVLMNREAPPALCRPTDQLLGEAAALQDQFPATNAETGDPSGNRISHAVTPRFAISCDDALLRGAGQLASQTDAAIQTHLAETRRECERVVELFDGRDYVQVYEEAGLLSHKSILGHGIYLNEADRVRLHAKDSIVAHCPTANSFLRSGTMPRQQWKRDSLRIAVGSDIGAGYERSMVRVGRAMIEAAASLGEDFPSPAEAWYDITAGNARILGWRSAGRIEIGCAADLIIACPDIAVDYGSDLALGTLMFAWDDRWIRHVFLRGRSG